MSDHFAMNSESLQTFLANAFAVQESGLDTRSLEALIEVQHFLAGEEFDLGRAMQLIADHALAVSDASGVGIGLLRSHELVYLAGSGICAEDIGRHVPAVLSASSQQETRREILRVENAASDPRIEAEICRQFGAMSLLMLPVYKSHVLAGVLQVLFEMPHSFREREVRVYRLMVGAVEEAILRATRPAREQLADAVEEIPCGEMASAEYVPSAVNVAPSVVMTAEVAEQATPEVLSAIGDHRHLWQSAAATGHDYLVRIEHQANAWSTALSNIIRKRMTWPSAPELWNAVAAVGVALALSTVIWISQLHRSSRTDIGLPAPTTREVQQRPAGMGVTTEEQKTASDAVLENTGAYRGFRRVRVGPAEVDYVSDDVTIRRFETRPAKAQIRSNAREVKFGDDVTLRYFVRPAKVTQSPDTSEASPTDQTPSHLR